MSEIILFIASIENGDLSKSRKPVQNSEAASVSRRGIVGRHRWSESVTGGMATLLPGPISAIGPRPAKRIGERQHKLLPSLG